MVQEPLDGDHLHAWSSGLNLLLYDSDPGPREVTVGGPGESRPVERREYLIDLYAQGLLLHVDADLDRLAAVAEHARAQTKVKKRLGGRLGMSGPRPSPLSSRR